MTSKRSLINWTIFCLEMLINVALLECAYLKNAVRVVLVNICKRIDKTVTNRIMPEKVCQITGGWRNIRERYGEAVFEDSAFIGY